MKHAISLGVLLALLWWCLSGYPKPLLLGLGLGSVLFTVWFAHRLDVVDHESHPLHISGALLAYWGRLTLEIVRSSAQVIGMILSPKPAIAPYFLRVKVGQPSDLGKVILGNSITLTPGTVTVLVKGDEFLVHALSPASGNGVRDGELDRLIPDDCERPA
ncbi:MAG: Na+/H+ antiporter subunit E [Steroidobacteraceae bacterium]|jgi:multicomponent Na+:H+ antiporter subunit E